MALSVAIFDDVLAARREVFHIPGLDVTVHADADQVEEVCLAAPPPAVLFMDYAMGPSHLTGAEAVKVARKVGYRGRIVATSSDPAANAEMLAAGADEALAKKALLRPFLLALGKEQAPG
jgi:CheY-like chemotaxis protein